LFRFLGHIVEWIVQFAFLSVIVAMGLLLVLLILLFERERVRGSIKIGFLQEKFDSLCELSDRLDEPYKGRNPLGSAMWVTRFILQGALVSVGLMILWIIILSIK
jgi:hypothetical protein